MWHTLYISHCCKFKVISYTHDLYLHMKKKINRTSKIFQPRMIITDCNQVLIAIVLYQQHKKVVNQGHTYKGEIKLETLKVKVRSYHLKPLFLYIK